jgi:hypothetical protein
VAGPGEHRHTAATWGVSVSWFERKPGKERNGMGGGGITYIPGMQRVDRPRIIIRGTILHRLFCAFVSAYLIPVTD